MRAYGKRKTRTPIAGHQNCGICHSDSKVGAARERQTARREAAAAAAAAWPPECGVDGICDMCLAPQPVVAWIYDEHVADYEHEALVFG